MKKKILYSLGGVFALFIVLAFLVPTPDPSAVQYTKQARPSGTSEAKESAGDTPTSIISTIEATPVATTAAARPTPVPTPIKTTAQYTYYPVTDVVDGDTIKVRMSGKEETLRLIGIDTPETVDPRKSVQCFGKEASNKARELLSGKNVRIEMDATQG